MFHSVVAHGAYQMVMHRQTALHDFFDIFVVQVYHPTYTRSKNRAKTSHSPFMDIFCRYGQVEVRGDEAMGGE